MRSTFPAADSIPIVSTSGTKRGTKEVPAEWLESVAQHIELWITEHGHQRLSGRKLAPMLGISQPTLTQLLNKKGALGIGVLMALRTALRKPIDELLGLPPLAAKEPALVSIEDARVILRAELESILRSEQAAKPARTKRA